MKRRTLGQSGIEASVIVLGTWAIGGTWWGGTDEAASIDAIRAAIDNGVNCIDTAAVYGFGVSETLVGKAIEGRRDQVVIATKCGLRWDFDKGEHFFDLEGKSVNRHLAADSIRWEVEQSLARLNIDCIDLYQTHWQDPTIPAEETMATLQDLKREGKIRAIGVSNCDAERMKQYASAGPLDCDQEKFSMLDPEIKEDQLPHCMENNIALLAYSPMAMGLLTGKLTPERKLKEGDVRLVRSRFSTENRARVLAMLNEFQPIAEHYELTIAQLVLAWTIAQPGVTHVLAGARNADQALENVKAGNTEISENDLTAIDKILEKHRTTIE
ncbi:MAG: aldo/keto reductase [Candidatus Hinthialibacter antarcticus]|nr:aldo/keto reductase [Candidatus Hinthialibacter antarcticus]